MRNSRDWKGIWIPKEIWLSEELSLIEKVLFVEIHSLDNERGCFASNNYFAEFFSVSDRQIRNVLAALKAKKFIAVTIQNRNERVIRTIGRYRRISMEEKQEVFQQKRQTVAKMRLGVPGRAEGNFRGGRK